MSPRTLSSQVPLIVVSADRQAIQALATDVLKQSEAASTAYEEQLATMRAEVAQNTQETRAAQETAQ